jgi:hypothetical protein
MRWLTTIGLLLATALVLGIPAVLAYAFFLITGQADAGIEAARITYSWPVAIAAVAMYLLYSQRSSISTLIRNLRRLKAGQFEAESLVQSLPDSFGLDPRKNEITWEEWYISLGQRFSNVDIQIAQEFSQEQQRILNSWIESWKFEKVWGQIYRSQYYLLSQLARSLTGLMSYTDAFGYFDHHVQERIARGSLEDACRDDPTLRETLWRKYLGFLESAGLMQHADDQIQATEQTGRFLEYCRAQGYSPESLIW